MSKPKDVFASTFNYSMCLEKLEQKLIHTQKRLKSLEAEDQNNPNVIDSIGKANADITGFKELRDEIRKVMSMDKYYKTGAYKMYINGLNKGLFMARLLYNCPRMICEWYDAVPDFGARINANTALNNTKVLKAAILTKIPKTELDAKHALIMANGTPEVYTAPAIPVFDLSAYPIHKYAWFVNIWLNQ